MSSFRIFDRPATYLLEALGRKLWGFRPNLMPHFVEENGPVNSVAWFAGTMPRYERILEDWGPIRTHLIASAISTLNGCRYCTHGHIRALQLHYLRLNDKLFPIDEAAFFELTKLSPDEMIERLVGVLYDADLVDDVKPLRRSFELYVAPERARDREDERLVHLIEMFEKLNECGVKTDAELDQVHDPINRDVMLQERYQILRAA